MSDPHSSAHGGLTQTIDEVLWIKFPRIHSSEETLASTTSRNFGPPLSPTFFGPGSKRSRQQIVAAEEDQSENPLCQDLISWQGSMPGHFIMHLQDGVRLKDVQSFDNLPLLLAEHIQTLPCLALPIPEDHRYASSKRTHTLFEWEDLRRPSTAVETIENLRDAHIYQGQLIAACASALAGNPAKFADTTDFLESTMIAPTIQPGSDEVRAAEYLVLNPTLPGMRGSSRRKHEIRYEAIEFFGLSAIQVTHIQPICEPLNAEFPLSAVVQFAEERLPLEPLICAGPDDQAHSCRSAHCAGGVLKFPRPFTTSGRPIGVDSDLALRLISQAKVTHLPSRKPLTGAERITVSLFLEFVWGVALAADATLITVSGVNEEMIFIRHRARQTLWLSNVLTVHRNPLSTDAPPHLKVHVGEAVFAHDDALSRAGKLEMHRREGTLPASFRYPFQNDIDLLNSNLTFEELSLSYELSIGKFLPPNLFRPEYTYKSNKDLFSRATGLRVHWDDDDASMLHFILDDFKSPLILPAVTSSSSAIDSVLDVKIHCFKQHSRRVFLCHLIDTNKKPYGRPLVMKLAWSPILKENEQFLEFWRIVKTPEIDHEFEILEQLAGGDPDVACRVPKPYGHFSGDVKIVTQQYKFSAYFVEDCLDCYPIGIADDIDFELRASIAEWLEGVHDRQLLLHGNLSTENILFKPSDPTCFYVVGWQQASSITNVGEEARRDIVEEEETLLRGLFVKKFHASGPPKKQGRLNSDEDEDEDEDEVSQLELQFESEGDA